MKIKFQLTFLALLLLEGCKQDYSDSSPLSEIDYFPLVEDNTDYVGMIDANGNEILKGDFQPGTCISPGTGHYFWIEENGGWRLFDINKPDTPPIAVPKANDVTPFANGLTLMQAGDDPICIMNDRLEVTFRFPREVTSVERLSNKLFAACIETPDSTTYTLYSPYGRPLYGPTLSPIFGGLDNLILIYDLDRQSETDNRMMIIDLSSSDKPIGSIDLNQYSPYSYEFHSGMLPVGNNDGELTYLDKNGKLLFSIPGSVMPESFGEIDFSFYDGYAIFQNKEGLFGIIDSEGSVKVRPKFTNLKNLGNSRFAAGKGELIALTDKEGNDLSERIYMDFIPVKLGDNYLFTNGDKLTIMNRDGKPIKTLKSKEPSLNFGNRVTYSPILPAIDYIVDIMKQIKTVMHVSDYMAIFNDMEPSEEGLRNNVLTKTGDSYGLTFLLEAKFNAPICSPVTREITENDGWFETTRTVTEGYKWSDACMIVWKVSFNLSGTHVSPAAFAERFGDALKRAGYKQADRKGLEFFLPSPDDPQMSLDAVITPGHHTVEITLTSEMAGC